MLDFSFKFPCALIRNTLKIPPKFIALDLVLDPPFL